MSKKNNVAFTDKEAEIERVVALGYDASIVDRKHVDPQKVKDLREEVDIYTVARGMSYPNEIYLFTYDRNGLAQNDFLDPAHYSHRMMTKRKAMLAALENAEETNLYMWYNVVVVLFNELKAMQRKHDIERGAIDA